MNQRYSQHYKIEVFDGDKLVLSFLTITGPYEEVVRDDSKDGVISVSFEIPLAGVDGGGIETKNVKSTGTVVITPVPHSHS
ncbi:MAG: hypothetical protein LBK50_01740 [Candidatus Nomurabacteria bacterium]|nr:hypothetical protein [Candidatus Nomurabacteria bacterium]